MEVIKEHIDGIQIQCPNCNSLLAYNEDDVECGYTFVNKEKVYYIVCPVCHEDISI